MSGFTRREWMAASTASIAAIAHANSIEPQHEHSFHCDHILGTSLDGWLNSTGNAEAAEVSILGEAERLRRIFSLYDCESELSRWNRTAKPVQVSDDLGHVLSNYQSFHECTRGACSPCIASATEVWKIAERTGAMPSERELAAVSNTGLGFRYHPASRIAERVGGHALNLNSIAKGYILQRMANVVRDSIPSGLLNLGGDMLAWGETTWNIGIQNPRNAADNAEPLATFTLTNASVATSGGYLRYATIRGERHSHLIDPRSGRPANGLLSSTVIAGTSVEANAWATSLAVMTLDEAKNILANHPEIDAALVTPQGEVFRTPGMPWVELPKAQPIQAKPNAWPAEYEVKIALELPRPEGGKYRKPYVAAWIEDAAGKPVRSLETWGNAPKYLKDLNDWWKFAKDNTAMRAVTRATRNPGKYELVWDGKDQNGNPVGQGTFVVKVEVHREHGRHLRQSGKIECLAKDASVKLAKNEETGETIIEYAKKKKS